MFNQNNLGIFMAANQANQDFRELVPERILGAVESLGRPCNGSILALNSYENRVYQVSLEDDSILIAKFYRANRWSDAAIREEHAFTLALAAMELPVVAPLTIYDHTLHHYRSFRFALYPRRGGHWPELNNPDNLMCLGRFIARIHALGAVRNFIHRPTLDSDSYGVQSYRFLLDHDFIPHDLQLAYRTLVEDVLERSNVCFQRAGKLRYIRLHGDCHPGNILWTDAGPHFVDFDDCRMGPAIQDLWMLLSGERDEMTGQLAKLLQGYSEFHDFDYRELHLIEALRSLRMLHYSAWLAQRWSDPAFPLNFPWFNTHAYWEQQILALREQLALLEEAPLQV